jgi:hypothetical protein
MGASLPSILRLEALGGARYRVANEGDAEAHNVVFGGQLLAQMIRAAAETSPTKAVKTIHAIFARAGRVDATTELAVETLHEGRAMASHSITAWQGERLCCRAMVLMSADEPDVIIHGVAMPDVAAPERAGRIHTDLRTLLDRAARHPGTPPPRGGRREIPPTQRRREVTDLATLGAYGVLTEPATLRIERLLPGPIDRVWDYLTDSDLRSRWLAAGEMDMKVGAPFELVGRNDELTVPPGRRPDGAAAEHRMQSSIT